MKAFVIPAFAVAIFVIFWLSFNSAQKIQQVLPLAQNSQTTLILTGDVMLGRSVMKQALEKSHPAYPFIKVADTLKAADIVLINLENPIVEKCPFSDKGTIFCSDPKMVVGLTHAGVDVVNLANNHTLNHGKNGLEQTKKYLAYSNILYTGTGELVTKEVNGTKFGFLGFEKSQLTSPKLTSAESDLIKQSNEKVDILVVSMHWGVEYQAKASAGQRALAREIVQLGGDIIAGHHPHWVQDMETIEGKPVYYSLGNFVFDQMWSEETKKGLVMKLTFDGKKLVNEEKLPVYIKTLGQPEFASEF